MIELDNEEKEILEMFENNEFKQISNSKEEMDKAIISAKNHLKKDARINIRLSQYDLDKIKRIAISEGLPYQTLISSVLHKFINKSLDN